MSKDYTREYSENFSRTGNNTFTGKGPTFTSPAYIIIDATIRLIKHGTGTVVRIPKGCDETWLAATRKSLITNTETNFSSAQADILVRLGEQIANLGTQNARYRPVEIDRVVKCVRKTVEDAKRAS